MEILLPKQSGEGKPVRREWFDTLLKELTDRFGGATSFMRSPGEGLWQNDGEKERDSIAVIEVMAEEVDTAYWCSLRERLERELMQNEIVIRAQAIQLLQASTFGSMVIWSARLKYVLSKRDYSMSEVHGMTMAAFRTLSSALALWLDFR